MAISKAILIGFGYHGKNRLFKSLLNLTQVEEILVFARDPSVLSNIEAHINGKKIRTTIDPEEMFEYASEETFVVVGITAKDRLDIVKKIVSRNVKYIYLEKPLAQSMADCDEMVNIIEKNNVHTAVGFYNDFLILTSNLDRLVRDYRLGELLKISSQGGAVCLSTNGLHFIDLANLLFESEPKEILGKVNSRIKNPRGTEYFLHDGLGYILYANGEELLLSYNNKSLISPSMTLHFEYGNIEADHDSEFIHVRGYESDYRDRPKYRYEKPVDIIEIRNDNNFFSFFHTIFSNLLNGGVYCDIKRAQQAMKVLMGILISDKTGTRLDLPIQTNHQYYHKKFPIT